MNIFVFFQESYPPYGQQMPAGPTGRHNCCDIYYKIVFGLRLISVESSCCAAY